MPGCARLGCASQDAVTQPGLFLSLFARRLLFSLAVFPIIDVNLAGAQHESHSGRASRVQPQEIQLVLSARLRKRVCRHCCSGGTWRYWHRDGPYPGVGLCQHPLAEQAWKNRRGPARHLWAWLALLFSALRPSPPLLSRNSDL